ncbi:MAG: response regulator [Microthrixaceae bacterium]
MGEGSGAIRVVLVDDHEMFTEMLSETLSGDPLIEVVGVAATGASGVWLASTHHPDVVVLDYQLPDGDAPTIAEILLAENPQTKVIVLTGRTDERSLLAALDAGCRGFVTKDRPLGELNDAIRRVQAGEAYVPASMLGALLPRAPRGGGAAVLTEREREVLDAIASGMTNAVLAEKLFVSVHTVRGHVQSILAKLGAHSKLEAVAIATREGLLSSTR